MTLVAVADPGVPMFIAISPIAPLLVAVKVAHVLRDPLNGKTTNCSSMISNAYMLSAVLYK
jgi:hypothetical protein